MPGLGVGVSDLVPNNGEDEGYRLRKYEEQAAVFRATGLVLQSRIVHFGVAGSSTLLTFWAPVLAC